MPDIQTETFLFGPLANYGMLVRDPATGHTVSIDCGDEDQTMSALQRTGWTLDAIWITHHHPDHQDGAAAVKAATGATVYGPSGSAQPIHSIDVFVGEGDSVPFGETAARIIATPGHTMDMVNYHLPAQGVLFPGDTIFPMGCGRLFEGDAATMAKSFAKIALLPDQTVIYGAHEYTRTNAKFAADVDPKNPAIPAALAEVEALLDAGQPANLTTLEAERETNPFLRTADPGIREALGMADATDAEVFAELRRRRDGY